MKYITILVLAAILSGCASVETKEDTNSDNRRNCQKIQRPGSNIPIYRC
jgi:PBP1b-binding outer membrane lipoprotein LpoB